MRPQETVTHHAIRVFIELRNPEKSCVDRPARAEDLLVWKIVLAYVYRWAELGAHVVL